MLRLVRLVDSPCDCWRGTATRRPFQCGVICQSAPSRNGGRRISSPRREEPALPRETRNPPPAILLCVPAAQERCWAVTDWQRRNAEKAARVAVTERQQSKGLHHVSPHTTTPTLRYSHRHRGNAALRLPPARRARSEAPPRRPDRTDGPHRHLRRRGFDLRRHTPRTRRRGTALVRRQPLPPRRTTARSASSTTTRICSAAPRTNRTAPKSNPSSSND